MRNESLVKARGDRTQVWVADKAGVSERVYQSYEAGTVEPRVSIAQQIAKVLNADVNDIFPLIQARP